MITKRWKNARKTGLLWIFWVMLAGCGLTETIESSSSMDDTTQMLETVTEEETPEEDMHFAQMEAYWESFQLGSMNPQISEKSVSWYADLDHDGTDERVVFDWSFLDNWSTGVLSIIDEGYVVYANDWIGTPHAGWTSYYVCQRGQKEYLLLYVPYTGTGWGEYRYELMELNSDGQMRVVEQDVTEFRLDSAENVKNAWPDYRMDIRDMAVFADGVNELLETSYLLVSTDQGWMDAELNKTDKLFVLGNEETPYRQYEQYRGLGGDLLAWQRTEKPEPGTSYERLRDWCEKEGMPYFHPICWEADLTHDGYLEKILFEQKDFRTGHVGTLTILDSRGQQLFCDEIWSDHGHSGTYYLCHWQGQDHLFFYKPYVIMGEGYNRYELFSLDEKGTKVVADSGSVRFYVDFLPSMVNAYGEKAINIPEMVAFADKVNEYVNTSYLLVCSDADWIRDIPYEKEQYYVAGNPETPYRQQENYHWYDAFEKELGRNFGKIKDVATKLKAWCEAAKMPYIE